MPHLSRTERKASLIHDVGFQHYFHGATWADLNRQFFDGLAPKYDRLNEVLSFGQHRAIKRRAVERLPVDPEARILDLCTGSGDIAGMFSRRYPKARITALDASDQMLRVAKSKSRGLENIRFMKGDAMKMDFSDGYFDLVFIGFGLRNLYDTEQALQEMIRVTRPGGWISILDLGKPQGRLRESLYAVYFETLIPFLGRNVFHRGEFNSFEYLPKSNRHFPAPPKIAALMTEKGLENVRIDDYLLGGISQQTGRVR